eukprot:COSAG01_NODE_18089_length_1101_cov_3.716567_1_plen_66_part_01
MAHATKLRLPNLYNMFMTITGLISYLYKWLYWVLPRDFRMDRVFAATRTPAPQANFFKEYSRYTLK